MSSDTEQTSIDPFREMNRYDDRDEDWPSRTVFEAPRRTLANGWQKYHAARDCGGRVLYIEEGVSRSYDGDGRRAYDLSCFECRHRVDEQEVLFIGGEWYKQYGWELYGRGIGDLRLPDDRVVALGPNPKESDLRHALELSRIERNAGTHGLSIGNISFEACDDCGQDALLTFDDRCRMCYDGEWTDRLQEIVGRVGINVRERNNSFVHRLPKQLDPLSMRGRTYEDKILGRRHDAENTTKLVEVVQCLQDDYDGHWEYVLTDMTHTSQWMYHEDDLSDCFWDTGLYNDESTKGVMDDRIREVYQRVCDHSFNTVHDPETGEPTGEQCLHCRKRRGGGEDAG